MIAVASLTVVGSSGPAAAGVGESCAVRFPELVTKPATELHWVVLRSGAVSIEATGLTPALAARFRDEIALVDTWITEEIGPYSATVCLVSHDLAVDFPGYEIGARRLHAHSDLPERLLLLNVHRVGFIAPAGAYALAQHALWQQNGDAPFPTPIARVIGQWYRARMLERLDQYRHDEMAANLFNTEPFVDWTSSSQRPIQDWEPEHNFSSIGVFVDFAVATHGIEVLLETEGARWSQIEGEWRVALRNELRGRDTDTTGWIGGAVLTASALLLAVIATTLGLIAKHRRKLRPKTPAPIPGFFSER